MKKIVIPILALGLCFGVFGFVTNGFQTFTVYSKTLHQAGPVPRAIPDLQLIDQDGNPFVFQDREKYVLLNFMYISCPNACHIVNNRISEIYQLVEASGMQNYVEMLTITFDTENDNLQAIKNYRNNFAPEADSWTFAIPIHNSKEKFNSKLKEFGLWVYQLPESRIINHSLYLFLISPDNRIVSVYDPVRLNNEQIIRDIQKHETYKP